MNKTRNFGVDALKVFMAIVIAMGHFGTYIISSGMVVSCFFVLSGYFLVHSFDSKKYLNSYIYTITRIKRIYPYYIIALVLLFAYTGAAELKSGIGIGASVERAKVLLPEIFFMQNVGVYGAETGINYPLWQLSVLIIAAHVIFELLSYNRNLTVYAICPLIAIMGCTYFSNSFNAWDVEWWGVIAKCVSAPLFRAFAGISVGVAVHDFINPVREHLERHRVLPTVVSGLSIVLYMLNENNYQCLIAFVVLMMSLLCENNLLAKIFNKPIFRYCEKISLSIYVNHALIIRIIRVVNDKLSIPMEGKASNVLFLIVLLLYSTGFMLVVERLAHWYTSSRNACCHSS